MQVERAHATRDSLCAALLSTGRVRLTPPQGAFYLFFGVDGVEDSVKAAIDMVDNANVGLAPQRFWRRRRRLLPSLFLP